MNIKTFLQLSKNDVKIAGGKGASLGEMSKAGVSVPPGFVVLAGAFDKFVQETKIKAGIESILKKVNPKDINSIDKASSEIRKLILEEKMPENLQKEISGEYKKLGAKFVAVRSSATAEDSKTASWAGELETYLNVTEQNLIKQVKMCWSSLFTPRAIFYRFEKKLHNAKISVAVVVQKMVQSQVSGICFTVHPVTKNYNQMVIEAGFGLGEAIVGGLTTPDTYVVDKKDFSILDINISEQNMKIVKTKKGNINKKLSIKEGGKQKLSGKQILELAKICKKIEHHYKQPQDIEWAFEKGKFFITQSRPITTL
jgi:pyruvate,water dikinase